MKSIQEVTSDGTLSAVTLQIQYLEPSHLKYYVDGTPAADVGYTVQLDGQTVRITPVVATGQVFRIKRETPNDQMFHIYGQHAEFSNRTMDENFKQVLFIQQDVLESIDRTVVGQNFQIQRAMSDAVDAKTVAASAETKVTAAIGQIQAATDAANAATAAVAAEVVKIAAAEVTANTAKATADAAKATAEGVDAKATSALSTAMQARTTADSAKAAADSVATTAASSLSTANTAKSTADAASATAASALTAANTAVADAAAKLPLAGGTLTGALKLPDTTVSSTNTDAVNAKVLHSYVHDDGGAGLVIAGTRILIISTGFTDTPSGGNPDVITFNFPNRFKSTPGIQVTLHGIGHGLTYSVSAKSPSSCSISLWEDQGQAITQGGTIEILLIGPAA